MCGIFLGYSEAEFGEEALKLIRHRGPDNLGFDSHIIQEKCLFIGHTRLAILDLDSKSNQPMKDHTGRFQIVFNGEIYNFLELRRELECIGIAFKTNSDTEVLINGWAQWGEAVLPKLRGMFAFAVYDSLNQIVNIYRDQFGIKPMYYYHEDEKFFAGSELPLIVHAIKKSGGHTKISELQSFQYLSYSTIDRLSNTFVDKVYRVRPGWKLSFDLKNNTKSFINWSKNTPIHDNKISFNKAKKDVKEAFFEAVRLQLRADVGIGVALSGGVDSSAIACVAKMLQPKKTLHTFSYINKEKDGFEENYIDFINAHLKATSHKVYLNPHNLKKDIENLVEVQGEPFYSTSMYAQYKVFQKVKDTGIKVLLEGQGADELLAGYNGYTDRLLLKYLKELRFARALKLCVFEAQKGQLKGSILAAVAKYLPDRPYFSLQDYKNRNLNKVFNQIPAYTDRIRGSVSLHEGSGENSEKLLTSFLIAECTSGGLEPLLRYGDRNAMANSIENRVPFLDQEFVNLIFSLPEDYLHGPGFETKHVFREAMRGVVPDNILDRKDKIGFLTPMEKWQSELTQQFIKTDPEQLGLPLKKEELRRLLNQDKDKYLSWRLLNLIMWASYVD